MNRPKKFRIWDSKLEKMYYSYDDLPEYTDQLLIDFSDGDVYSNYPDQLGENCFNPESHMIPMDFIGLKDKNGKYFHEGDIVKYPYVDNIGDEENKIAYGEVKFSNGEFVLIVKSLEQRVMLSDNPSSLEIIGNKYENPELLKGVIC